MKKITCLLLTLTVILSACKKNKDDSITGWSEEDHASYNSVMALQKTASANYVTWSQTMDSLAAINKLAQFFLSDPLVSSATIGSQGVMVQYANGMGGGIFLNPMDSPGYDTSKLKSFRKENITALKNQPVVNRKEMILLNPSYWDRFEFTDPLIASCNYFLPMAGFSLSRTYVNDEADVDQFTKLSGYGIIHIYTHGLAWPDEENLSKVYLMTGEVENEVTSSKYWEEIRNKDIIIEEVETSYGSEFVYWISEKFVTNHNDFSKDTVLFYGGFCFSFLGNWPKIQQSFAAGTYFGFDWAVRTGYNADWASKLEASLSDTNRDPVSSVQWYNYPEERSYYCEESGKTVRILYTGDTLLLWKKPIFIGQHIGGGIIFYIDASKRKAFVCAKSDYQPYWPYIGWGCFGTLIGTATAIGTGKQNTLNIIRNCTELGAAAWATASQNGYNDWYLPSKDELNEMFKQRTIIGANAKYYWSSSEWGEDPAYAAWVQTFALDPPGQQNPSYKSYDYNATRAIRDFYY